MEIVTLVFTDKRHKQVNVSEAYEICRNKKIKGAIIDALTQNEELQASLRALIDT